MVRDPDLQAVRPGHDADRIDAYIDPVDEGALLGVDDVHRVAWRVRHVDEAAQDGDGPRVRAREHGMADAFGHGRLHHHDGAGCTAQFALEKHEEVLQVGVLRGVLREPPAAAVATDVGDLVEDVVAVHLAEQILELGEVLREVIRIGGVDEHQAGVAGPAAFGVATDTDSLNDRGGDRFGEHICGGIRQDRPARRRRQVGQVSRRRRQQAHRNDRLLRFDDQLPLAATVAESQVFQFLGVQRPAPAGRHINPDQIVGILAFIVDAGDVDRGGFGAGVEDPQPAQLVDVGARIEDRDAVPVLRGRCRVVHGGQESVRGADVRQDLDVEIAGEFQAPIAHARSRAGEPLGLAADL